MKITEIHGNEFNPRTIREPKFKKLVDRIAEGPAYLKARPIVIDQDNMVLGGNMRLRAAEHLGFKEVPVMIFTQEHAKENNKARKALDKPTATYAEQCQEFVILDNASFGDWDWEALGNLWTMPVLDALGLDLPVGTMELPAAPNEMDDPKPQDIAKVSTTIVPGDLIEIGKHRLVCGDSTTADDIAKLMGDQVAELIYTDPPYSSGGSQEAGKGSGSIGARGAKKIKNDNLSTRGYRLLMNDVLSLHQNCHSVFIFCDWRQWIETFDISERAGYRVRNMIVWDKVHMGMGMPFRNQHELCLFGSKIAGKIGDGKTPNVLQHERDREAEHNTPKPVGLIASMLKQIDSDNVLDPFIGGGSTMLAAHQLKRTCFGMELDPKYCQVTIDRMKQIDKNLVIKINGKKI